MMGHSKAVKPMATFYADMAENSSQPAPIEPTEHTPTPWERVTAWVLLIVVIMVEVFSGYWGVRT